MNFSLRKIPIGVQDFRELRRNDYMYIDKTSYILDLINMNKYYFLPRPRRFGKSLLCSTMKYLFL
ncbi:AAA family ATPase [Persephonella sp.]